MQLDSENPWPGLEPFEEDAQGYFFGRDREANALRSHVLDAPVTVLYGRSGLGKTSLLRAGLFPSLREQHFLPVYVRFELTLGTAPLTRQLRAFVHNAITSEVPGAILPSDEETLWEYLHHKDFELWSARNYPLTPLVVLDQFEELFTLGERVPDLVNAFRDELGDLAENRIPADLAARIDHDAALAERFNLRSQGYKLLISLREDFLPELEGWSRLIPSLGRSRVRLLPLRADEAVDAVHKPAAGLMTEPLARRVVGIIAAEDLRRGHVTVASEAESSREVEPALLSLFCRELNEERKRRGLAHFDEGLVEDAERDILSNYYRACVRDMPPRVARFIESELITEKGFRDSYIREDAVPSCLTEDELSQLISSRLLRLEDHYGAQRIELTHDVLTGVVREHRDRRRAEEEKAALAARAEHERERRLESERAGQRLKSLLAVLVVVCVLAIVLAAVAATYARSAKKAQQAADSRLRETTALKLTSQGQAMLAGKRSGGEVRALQQLLAAEKIDPGVSEGALLDALIARRNMVRIIDTGAPSWSVAFSPDGSRMVSGSPDGALQLWDTTTGQPIGKPLTGHQGAVNGVAFSPDGHRIVSGSADRTVRLWNADTGQPIIRIPVYLAITTEAFTSVAFSPDGHRVVSGGADSTVRIWDADTGQPIGKPLNGHADKVLSVAFSPDGHRIASGSADSTVRLWDADTGQPIGTPFAGHTSTVLSVAFSPDGHRIVSGGRDDTVRVWDADSGQQIRAPLIGHDSFVDSVAFSPDGRRVVSGSADRTARVWDPDTGQQIGEPLSGHGDTVLSVAFSPDGQRILTGSRDKTVRVWNTTAGRPMTGHIGWVDHVAFSPDSRRIATAGADGTVRLWSIDTGQPVGEPLTGHTGPVLGVAFSPDGRLIASAGRDATVRLWNADTGQPVGEPLTGHTGTVMGVAFSPDGRILASAGRDRTVRLWNSSTGASAGPPLVGHTDAVWSAAFSPDGTRIVSGSTDGTVRLWDVNRHQQIGDPMTGHTDMVTSVAFSPDGTRIVSGSADGTVRLWDANRHQQIGDPMTGHTATVMSVVFSPDGTRIVSGSSDHTVRLWDLTGEPIGSPITGHEDDVSSVAVSPDGQYLASGSGDGTVRVWPGPAVVLSNQLCDKLTRNISAREWSTWIPGIPYEKICDRLPTPPDDGSR